MESFDSTRSNARMGRRQHMGLQMISAAEALQLENMVRKNNTVAVTIGYIRPYLPVILW
jgi:hypothetical protein